MNNKQREILKYLKLNKGQRYSEIFSNCKGNEEEKFYYHITYLVKNGYVEKRAGIYYLTVKGESEFSNFKWETLENVDLPLVYIDIVCKHNDQFLIKKKITEPFKDWLRLPGFRLESSESILLQCRNFLKIENPDIPINYQSTHHRSFKDKNGNFVKDTILIIFRTEIQNKEDIKLNDKLHQWMNIDEIKVYKNRWPEVELAINDNTAEFIEYGVIREYN